jgi:hypothetical protein
VNNIIEILVGIVVGNSFFFCKKGFGRKNQLNAFTLRPMTHGTIMFNEFLSQF